LPGDSRQKLAQFAVEGEALKYMAQRHLTRRKDTGEKR
jgi:hypothetical protein